MRPFLITVFLFFSCGFVHSQTQAPRDSLDKPVRLKLLTWNIYMLPEIAKRTKQDERAREIGESLKGSDYDVLVLQEVFRKKSQKIIYSKIRKEFPYSIGPDRKMSLKANSGVWIVSKVPLRKIRQLSFGACSGIPDCMARKGATMVEGRKDGKKFQLIGTHLQAEDQYPATRLKQLRQIMRELVEPFAQKDVPLLIAGDLNVNKLDTAHYTDMLQTLKADDGELEGQYESTYTGLYTHPLQKTKREILDYVLILKNRSKVFSVRREAKWFRSRKQTYSLSDHLGVEMEILY